MTTAKAEALEAHVEYGIVSTHLNLKIQKMCFCLLITMNLVDRVIKKKGYIK